MARAVWKYPLELGENIIDRVPMGATFLDVQVQGRQLAVWALVDDDAPPLRRVVYLTGTGNLLPRHSLKYIATVQQGPFVWHAFEYVG